MLGLANPIRSARTGGYRAAMLAVLRIVVAGAFLVTIGACDSAGARGQELCTARCETCEPNRADCKPRCNLDRVPEDCRSAWDAYEECLSSEPLECGFSIVNHFRDQCGSEGSAYVNCRGYPPIPGLDAGMSDAERDDAASPDSSAD
jgi:hypothetical protein